MSSLVLIRHGQARPFEADSDRLSDAGKQQAARLGQYWRERGARFDQVYSGALKRHIQTAELAGFADFERLPDFNEYDAGAILRAHPDFAPPTDNRHMQQMFEAAMPMWVAGTLEAAGLESWASFRGRVLGAFRSIVDDQRPSRRVAVFTSAGPIGAILQSVLCAPEIVAIELHWRIRNCSLTEVVFRGDRISLDSFNATPHLNEVTYR